MRRGEESGTRIHYGRKTCSIYELAILQQQNSYNFEITWLEKQNSNWWLKASEGPPAFSCTVVKSSQCSALFVAQKRPWKFCQSSVRERREIEERQTHTTPKFSRPLVTGQSSNLILQSSQRMASIPLTLSFHRLSTLLFVTAKFQPAHCHDYQTLGFSFLLNRDIQNSREHTILLENV